LRRLKRTLRGPQELLEKGAHFNRPFPPRPVSSSPEIEGRSPRINER
jgi:hypothetical protein